MKIFSLIVLLYALTVLSFISSKAQAEDVIVDREVITRATAALTNANRALNQCLDQSTNLAVGIQQLQQQILSTCIEGAMFEAVTPDGDVHKFYCSQVTEL